MTILHDVLAPPVSLRELDHQPGGHSTWQARGSGGSAILTLDTSEGAHAVADRLAGLVRGPATIRLPAVLLNRDQGPARATEVDGKPLRDMVLAGDMEACEGAGAALGRWHAGWVGVTPSGLRRRTLERELALLIDRASTAPAPIRRAVASHTRRLVRSWACETVVLRTLDADQLLLDVDGSVAVVGVDDVGLGPPELDLGNLLAYLVLLGLRRGTSFDDEAAALLSGHASTAGPHDVTVLAQCRQLALLLLACDQREPVLLEFLHT